MAATALLWLDWWLEPRWRALLTWVAISLLMWWVLVEWQVVQWIVRQSNLVLSYAGGYLPFRVPMKIWRIAASPTVLLLLWWIQPVVLQIGWWRGILWLAGVVMGGCATALLLFPAERWINVIIFGQLFGIPGLAAIGRRSRPWMSLIGSIAATTVAYFMLPASGDPAWWLFLCTSLIYGAVMLYGTNGLAKTSSEAKEVRVNKHFNTDS